jgi:hypothetical protein
MTTQFNILFVVGIKHTFYCNECNDFDFIIPSDTSLLLKNGRLISKIRDGKLYVLYEADESNLPLKSIAGNTLRAGLKLNNPFFYNFTKPEIDISLTSLYQNKATENKLDNAKGISLVGRIFCHQISKPVRPVKVVLKNNLGNTLQTDTITSSNERSSLSYNLAAETIGILTVEEIYIGEKQNTTYYSYNEMLGKNIFGMVEITIADNFYSSAPEFDLKFEAKPETQKYYVIAKNFSDQDLNQLSVSDNGFAADIRPKIDFIKINPEKFTEHEIKPSLLSDSSSKLVLFMSQGLVSRSEKARKNIQLSKNGDILIKHLPQPAIEKSDANIIIQISKP